MMILRRLESLWIQIVIPVVQNGLIAQYVEAKFVAAMRLSILI